MVQRVPQNRNYGLNWIGWTIAISSSVLLFCVLPWAYTRQLVTTPIQVPPAEFVRATRAGDQTWVSER
jgi:hypothetical protein